MLFRSSEYARYGVHELIAEIGRIITSTPLERSSPSANIGKVDQQTVDFLMTLIPGLSRPQLLNVIRMAFPGIQIKQFGVNNDNI